MIYSIGLILFAGLLVGVLFSKINIPPLVGMLFAGIIMGPAFLNIISSELLSFSIEIRNIVIIILLLRVGLGVNKKQLMSVGKESTVMSFVPGLFEGLSIAILSIILFDFTFVQGGILGFIIAAVSPAVVVPKMLELIKERVGEKNNVPTMILTAASVDDVIAITIFTSFLNYYLYKSSNIIYTVLSVPLSIILGVLLGVAISLAVLQLFRKIELDKNMRAVFVFGVCLIFYSLSGSFSNIIPVASLLGIAALGFMLSDKDINLGNELSIFFGHMWLVGKIFLFILVGATVDIDVAVEAGAKGIILITIGVLFRSLGVIVSLHTSKFNIKEKLFSVICYTPKATVQAAIGGIPLAMGVAGGDIILAISVISIILTAPAGAILIDKTSHRLLDSNIDI